MRMFFLLFLIVPLVELAILIEAGGLLGVVPTLALLVLTAAAGVALLKRQGGATLMRGLARLDGGELPGREVAEGVLLAIAGALLVTPGFLTDGVGFALLAPAPRARLAGWLLGRIALRAAPGGRVIEGDFRASRSRHPSGNRVGAASAADRGGMPE